MKRHELPRRQFLKSIGAAAIAGPALLKRAAEAATPRRLNVVMIVADDQRHDTIAALGNDHIQTPTQDRLVREGFAFTRARCMGSLQPAVCVPSRAMLHTGRTLFRVPSDLGNYPMLGEVLMKEGYNSFGCGKWHNGPKSFNRGFNSGGNIYFGGMTNDQYHTPVSDYSPSGSYGRKNTHAGDKFSSELFADAAVEFLQQQRSVDKPFYCYLAFTSPHDPRTPPPLYKKMYDPAKMPLPKNFLPQHPFDTGELRGRDEKLAPFPRTEADTRQQLCDYYGMISSQDAQVGRILLALEESGHADNTIIIYTGDHGLAIGSHGLFGKQNVYEHSASIPLLMSGPGIPRGGRSDALVYGFDVFPTLCSLLNITPPDTIEGKSLDGILTDREQNVRDSSFHTYVHYDKGEAPKTQRAVNDGRWKYIRFEVSGQTHVLLFDLKNDPDEIQNLAQDSAGAKELPRLEKLARRWRSDLGEKL
jgi:arylsulfatase A-like enzyme